MSDNPQTIKRRIQLLNLIESSEHLIDVPRVHDLTSLMIVLEGTITVATAAGTAVPAESPTGLIKRIDLIANGKDVLEQVPFSMAVLGNAGRKFVSETTAPGLTVAAHPFKAVAFLDRNIVDGMRSKDTSFQAYLTNLFQIRLTTGQASDIVTPDGTTVLTLSNTTIEIVALTLMESKDRGEPKWVRKRTLQSQNFTGADGNFRFRLPTGNHIRSVQLHCLDDGEPTDDLLNNVQLAVNGVDVRHNLSYGATRSENRARAERAIPAGFVNIDAIDSSEPAKGSNFWDLTRGELVECVLDVAAPAGALGTVEMIVDEYIGVR